MAINGSSAKEQPNIGPRFALCDDALVTEINGWEPGRTSAFLRNRSGALFRIGPQEFFLLQGLADGRGADDIAVACRSQLNLSVPADAIVQFAEQMVGNGILTPYDEAAHPKVADDPQGDPEPGNAGALMSLNDDDLDAFDDVNDAMDALSVFGDDITIDRDEPEDDQSDLELDIDPEIETEFQEGFAAGADAGATPDAPEMGDFKDTETGRENADRGDPAHSGFINVTSPDVTERDVKFGDRKDTSTPPKDMDIVLFDPTRMLRVLGAVFWLPGRILGSTLMIPIGILAFLSIFHRLDEVGTALTSLSSSINIVGRLAVSLITVNLLSRLATGVVIQRRGGEVRRFGLIFMLFVIPRFSIDMTHISKLDRDGRVAVFASGLRAKFLIFTICTVIWAISRQSGSGFADTMAIVGQVALFGFFIGGFPLLSGEGYQLLCAYFNMPMLRERSMAYLFGSQKKGQKPPTAGETWAYSLYGIGSLVFSALLLTVLVAYVTTALEGRFGGTGVVIFLVLLGLALTWFAMMRRRGKRIRDDLIKEMIAEHREKAAAAKAGGGGAPGAMGMGSPASGSPMAAGFGGGAARTETEWTAAPKSTALVPLSGRSRDLTRQPAGLPTAPLSSVPGRALDRPGPMAGVYGGKEKKPWLGLWARRLIAASAVVSLIVVAFLPYNYETGGDFVILANDRVEVVAWVASELATVAVDEGDTVAAGDLLATQVDTREAYRLQVSRANLAKAQAQLQDLIGGASPEEIEVAAQEVERQRIELPYLEAEAERAQELLKRGFMPDSEAERIMGNFESGKAELRSAEAQLQSVRAGAQDTEIAILQADINRLEAEVAFNNSNLQATQIKAPVPGRVVFDDTRPVPGKFYDAGDFVMEIVGQSTARAEIEVPEADIGLVNVGERVRLKFWALPDQEQLGTVSSLAPVAEDEEFGKIVRIKTTLPNQDGMFRPGMTGYAKIEGEEMRVWEAYTRLFVRFFLIEFWGWIP